ncbi:MAG: hypothetical protein NT075_00110 [Chloroflexi bacterium]|nr:hypothetical protein [Chloroflexota bacterium]
MHSITCQIMRAQLRPEYTPYTMKVGIDCATEDRLRAGLFLEGGMKAGGDFFEVADVHA